MFTEFKIDKRLLVSGKAFACLALSLILLGISRPATMEASSNPRRQELLEKLLSEETAPLNPNLIRELLKVTYSRGDWPSFFGYAQFYRKNWNPKELDQSYQLELLALLRHCRHDLVISLVEYFLAYRPEDKSILNQIRFLSEINFAGKASEVKSVFRTTNRLSGNNLWKADKDAIFETPPQKLKIEVRSLCEE